MQLRRHLLLVAFLGLTAPAQAQPADAPALHLAVTNQQKTLRWNPQPHTQNYQLLTGTNLAAPLTPEAGGASPFARTLTNAHPHQFYRLDIQPLGSNALLAAQALNRLAYGPTPDELERIAAIGPEAWIAEQLAPETLVESVDAYNAVTTNAVSSDPSTNWVRVVATGIATGSTMSNLYIYLTSPGTVLVDDFRVVAGTDPDAGPSFVVNGDFESPLTNGWTVAANLAGSHLTTESARSGASCLRLVSTAAGSGTGSSIRQTFASTLTNNQIITLSFWYLPSADSGRLSVRVGSGTQASGAEVPTPPTWVYAEATGIATENNTFYLYASGDCVAFVDDIKLVAGAVAGVGNNLLANGGFESGTNGWRFTADFTNSVVVSNLAFTGNACLRLDARGSGTGSGDAISQTSVPGVISGAVYTVSFWYVPATKGRSLTARLSGSGTLGLLELSTDYAPGGRRARLDNRNGQLHHLRAWHVQNAVGARRQLLEVLLQFLENHFVTEHDKSRTYLDAYYDNSSLVDRLAADWEFRENQAWRTALLRPDCTFHDLLTISAESPAMIIYLDTVASRGDGRNVANENYARELFELFCMGVDNGYEQLDIVALSRAWTGWTVEILPPGEEQNPFATRSTVFGANPGSGYNAVSNLLGTWSFRFRSDRHGTNRAPILSQWHPNSTSTNLIAIGPKTVPARFGPPWAGLSCQLVIPPGRTGTNGIRDGYDVLAHLANLPMTAEYISVKLCRLFIHDDFPNPTTRPELPEYAFYDYTNPQRSAEAELVRQCMLAWWNSNPRGQIRPVLTTIFNSELFRTRAGISHKVKTPLEYAASVLRATRAVRADGSFTAGTDGFSIAGTSRDGAKAPLTRMGSMLLFDRDAPDGYPENGPSWISAGTLAERARFTQAALMAPSDTAKNDGMNTSENGNLTDPVALLKLKLPPAQWSNAGAVADYFLSVCFPAEGAANLAEYRGAAVSFLNTADNGTTSSPFANLGTTSTTYDTRVRGVVAMLLIQQRFQEQ